MNLIKIIFVLCIGINVFASSFLTQEEKNWIKENPIVKVGADSNWPPFDFVDKENNHKGISSEYLEQVSLSTGLNFEIYASKWSDVMTKIKSNEIDILSCAASTKNREKFLSFTEPYLNIDIAVVTRKDFEIDDFEDIKSYKIALPKDNYIHEKLKTKFPNAEFVFVKSNEEALEYISYKKADIYIGNLPVISHIIEKNLLTNLVIAFKAPFQKVNLSIAVNKEKKLLFSILNKAIKNIPENKRLIIQKRWINTLKTKTENKRVTFNLKEKKWLKQNETIKLSGDPFWPPYSFYDEDGKYSGIVPDLVNEIFKDSSINVEYEKTKNWSETLSSIENKNIHMIDAISYSNKRSKFLNFSSTYLGAEIVIISNKSHDTYVDSLKSIANKKIATVRGYSIIEKLEVDYPSIKELILIDNPLAGLKSLLNGQIDYFLLDIPSFEYYNKKNGLSNLKIVGPTGYTYRYGFGIRKDSPELLSIMNKLLSNVSQNKKDEIYRSWVKLDYEEKIDYSLVWKVLIGAFFVLAGTVYWNRKLHIEIERREKVQKALQESKDFTTAVMDSQVDIVITTSGEEIQQANKSFYKFFDYENLDEFKKDYRCICDLFGTSNPDKYILPLNNGLTWIDLVLNNPDYIYKALIYKNEEAFIFKITAAYISEKSNLKTAVFTDITKLEDLNEVLLKAKNEALNVAKQKSEFLANMSHEIRTPMNSVIGFTELLDKEITNPIQRDYLTSIKKGGTALLRIINDILDLSKIEAGKLEIKNESINPTNLFLEIESIFHAKIVSKNINFIIDIDKNIPNYVILDGVRIRQILFNLIGNAIKFTEKGYIKLKVENVYKDNIKSKIDLIFSIEDTGIGIDKDNLKQIFNSFEQQKEQDTAKYGGTGLGLAICTKLVEMMNGKIEVQSQKTKGSTFKVSLFDIPVSSLSEETHHKKIDIDNIIFEDSTILVVDDIEENRKLVDASLKNYKFKLIMAENGEDALQKLQSVKIDLILMDLRMPVMDGYEAAIAIKENEKLKHIPLLALTASVMGKDLEKVSKYGFDGYLRKPVILDDLIEELTRFIPYELKESVKNDTLVCDDTMNKESLEYVLNLLSTEIKDNWEDVKNKGDFTLIEEFSIKLKDLALENNITLLGNYAQELITHIDSFDIEKVDYLMNTYLDVIEKLEEIKESVERG